MSQETKQSYFVPEVEKGKPLPLDKGTTDYEPTLADLGGQNGVIDMKLESSVVMERLAKDIYKDFRSGFRELYANAVSASVVAKQLFKASPRIEIEIDPKKREFIIREFDSIGMSPEVFRDVYTVVGRSGNFEGTRPGQFGFGRLAWVTLSDRMIMETRYRTTDGKNGAYAVQGQGGKSFVVLPQPTIKAYGTSVKMILYERIDLHNLVGYIRKACELSKIDTFLTLTSAVKEGTADTDGDEDADWEDDNDDDDDDGPSVYKAGTVKLNISYRDKALRIMKSNYDLDDSKILKDYLLTGDGWELYGAFTYGERDDGIKFMDNDQAETTSYILGLPIEAELADPFNVSIVNILDERKFQPTADRERLKSDSEETLSKLMVGAIRRALGPIHAANLTEYMKLPSELRIIINAIEPNGEDSDDVGSYLDRATAAFAQQITTGVSWRTKSELSGSGTRYSNKGPLCEILASKPIDQIFLERGRHVAYHDDAIFTLNPDAAIISCFGAPAVLTLLKNEGARLAVDYLKSIPSYKKPKSALHPRATAYSRSGVIHKVGKHTIKVPKNVNINKYRGLLEMCGLKTQYSFAVDKPISYAGVGVMLDDFVKSIASTPLVTNKGQSTIADLPATPAPLLVRLARQNFIPLLEGEKRTIVFANDDDILFQVALYRAHGDKKVIYDFEGEEAVKRLKATVTKEGYYYGRGQADSEFERIAVYKLIRNKQLARLVLAGMQGGEGGPARLLDDVLGIPEIIDADIAKKLQLTVATIKN